MATLVDYPIKDADNVTVNSQGVTLDNGRMRPTLAIGGPDNAADLAPVHPVHGLKINPGAGLLSETFDATGTSDPEDVSLSPKDFFTLQVSGVAASADAWTVHLQTSLDGVKYGTILTHSNTTDADGGTVSNPTPQAARYFRVNVAALTLGSASDITVTVVGK